MADRKEEIHGSNRKVQFDKDAKVEDGGSPLRNFGRARYSRPHDLGYYHKPGYRSHMHEIHRDEGRYYDLSPHSRYDYLLDAPTAAGTDHSGLTHGSCYAQYRGTARNLGYVHHAGTHIYESPTRVNRSYSGHIHSCSKSPIRDMLHHRSVVDPPHTRVVENLHHRPAMVEEVHYSGSPIRHGLPGKVEEVHYRGSPVRHDFPDHVEVSVGKYSPCHRSTRYFPAGGSPLTAGSIHRELGEAERRAADSEARRREETQRRIWAEEDACREIRKRLDAEDRLAWEASQRARKEHEDIAREEFNRREMERKDRDRMLRERDLEALRRKDQIEREMMDRDLEERKRMTDELLRQRVKGDIENAKIFDQMMPKSYDEPKRDIVSVIPDKKNKNKKKKPKKKKKLVKRKPNHDKDACNDNGVHRVEVSIPVDQNLIKSDCNVQKQKYSSPKVHKARVHSANPKRAYPLNNVTEEEYLKVLYPDIDFTSADVHCLREHKKEWFNDFMKRVFEKSIVIKRPKHDYGRTKFTPYLKSESNFLNNQVKYDLFMQRCMKTSPYNDNGGENYSMLKKMVRHRSNSPKKNYQRNTIASLAKAL
ncbi:unnamed protein product [Moneuplotes crassus]|uniref:Uncharacterized protein n=1 Tax=Euplotes crassus TaxID=5936 RepID=A0AAD1X9K6_EUPCR|nr:unnamed protein product [Moneuplotes crassus]